MGQLVFLPKTNSKQRWGCGCIVMDSNFNVLMGKRNKPGEVGQWSFGGGKVELLETPLDGVIREMFEEFQIAIQNPEFIGSFELDGVADYIFFTNRWIGKPVPTQDEFSEMRWVPVDEVQNLDLFPYSEKAFELLIEWMLSRQVSENNI